jgi:hypothetical protein
MGGGGNWAIRGERGAKKTGGDDMMGRLLVMDGGKRKVLAQSLFFLRRGACLIVFAHVINHHRKDISPTHEKDLTGSFFFFATSKLRKKYHEFNKKIIYQEKFIFRSSRHSIWNGNWFGYQSNIWPQNGLCLAAKFPWEPNN